MNITIKRIAAVLSIPFIVMIIAAIVFFNLDPHGSCGAVMVFLNVFYTIIACILSAVGLNNNRY